MSFLGRKWSKRFGVWARDKLLFILVLVFLLWLGFYFTTSPDYRVTEITVTGNVLTASEDLVSAAGVRNQPILLLNHKKAEESILKLRAVKSAEVRSEFPNHASIRVIERTAEYIWKVKDTLYLASDDGIIVGTTPTANQMVALVDVDGTPTNVGGQVDADALHAAKALSSLLPREMSITPAYFEYSRSEGVVLPTDFAGRVVFGKMEDLEDKVATFKALKQAFQEKNLKVKYVDLRFKDKPYFR